MANFPVNGPSLGSLLRDRVPVSPHEAVAVVDELCRARTSLTSVQPFAPLDALVLEEFGSVARLARRPPDERARTVEAALALRAMLPDASSPDDSDVAASLRGLVRRYLDPRALVRPVSSLMSDLAPFRRGPSRAHVLEVRERWRALHAGREVAPPAPANDDVVVGRALVTSVAPAPTRRVEPSMTVVDISGDDPLPWEFGADPQPL